MNQSQMLCTLKSKLIKQAHIIQLRKAKSKQMRRGIRKSEKKRSNFFLVVNFDQSPQFLIDICRCNWKSLLFEINFNVKPLWSILLHVLYIVNPNTTLHEDEAISHKKCTINAIQCIFGRFGLQVDQICQVWFL